MDELAAQFGFSYSTVSAGIDEKEIRNDDPEELVMTLAHAKAVAIGMRWQAENAMPSEGGFVVPVAGIMNHGGDACDCRISAQLLDIVRNAVHSMHASRVADRLAWCRLQAC